LGLITDTHCHLDFEAFDEDRELVLQRACEAGVRKILNPGVDLSSSQKAIKLAEAYEDVFAAVGIHPNSAQDMHEDSIQIIYDLATRKGKGTHPKAKAIGEIGLDYYRDRTPHEIQRRVFRDQLKLAEDLKLPVVIHNRQATSDLLQILNDWHR